VRKEGRGSQESVIVRVIEADLLSLATSEVMVKIFKE